MARHLVRFKAPSAEVGKADVVFRVKSDGRALGRLKVSQGRVEWMPSARKKNAYEMTWDDVDKFFPKYGNPVKTRSRRK